MDKCPYCHSSERQVQAGRNPSGSQRWRCQQCRRRYTPDPNAHGYPTEQRLQAVQWSVDGSSYRQIALRLGVDHKTVSHWVKAYTDQLPTPPMPEDVNNAELDELFTFVETKTTSSTS